MDFVDSLLTSQLGGGVSPELLEMLGQKASSLYLEKKVPLNDAVKQVLEPYGNLNNEHIKRVAEFANVNTFQRMHETSQDKVIDFPIADPGVVLRDLRDGGSPAHSGKGVHGPITDYATAPKMEKDEFADPESAMEHLFQMEGREGRFGQGDDVQKVASVDSSYQPRHSNPYLDVYDEHVRLQAMRSHLAEANESFDLMMKEAREELYQHVKREVLSTEGAGINGVIAAFGKLASSEMAGAVLMPMVQRLMHDGIRSDSLQVDGVKVAAAGQVLNHEHPIVQTFAGMLKCAEEMLRTQIALQDVDASLMKTAAFLKRGTNG